MNKVFSEGIPTSDCSNRSKCPCRVHQASIALYFLIRRQICTISFDLIKIFLCLMDERPARVESFVIFQFANGPFNGIEGCSSF
jgi:hypothetical protein